MNKILSRLKKIRIYEWVLLIAVICAILIPARNRTVSLSDNPECKMLPCAKGSDGKTIIIQGDYYDAMEKINKRDEE